MTFHNMFNKPLQLPWLRIHVPKYSAPLGDPLSILNILQSTVSMLSLSSLRTGVLHLNEKTYMNISEKVFYYSLDL